MPALVSTTSAGHAATGRDRPKADIAGLIPMFGTERRLHVRLVCERTVQVAHGFPEHLMKARTSLP